MRIRPPPTIEPNLGVAEAVRYWFEASSIDGIGHTGQTWTSPSIS